MGFSLRVDGKTRVLEVIYPATPSAEDVAVYLRDVRKMIDDLSGAPWRCLVDQRGLVVMSPELTEKVSTLITYAAANGMSCSARVVSTAVGALQASRLSRSAPGAPVRAFRSRDEALAWLLGDGK